MRPVQLGLLAATLLAVAGCASAVRSTITVFHRFGPADVAGQTIAIRAYPPEAGDSLEFATYRQDLAARLAAQHFVVVDESAKPRYIAFLSYGIDTGRSMTETRPVPLYGAFGGQTTVQHGVITTPSGKKREFHGTTYTMPTYGYSGYVLQSYTTVVYSRNIAVDIVVADSLSGKKPERVYEGRVTSLGRCPSLAPVFGPMLDALFQNFPGTNGASRTVEIPGGDEC